jgi:hypothetical protein
MIVNKVLGDEKNMPAGRSFLCTILALLAGGECSVEKAVIEITGSFFRKQSVKNLCYLC